MKTKTEALIENLHNYQKYDDYLSWMSALMNTPKELVNENITPQQLMEGCCEDFGVYFCIKYGVPLWCFDDAHFLLVIGDKYYDGFNNFGVSNLKDLEFVKMFDSLFRRYESMLEEKMQERLKSYDCWKDYDLYKTYAHLIRNDEA